MLIGLVTTIAFFGFGVYEYEAAQPGYNAAQMAKLADNVEAPAAVAVPLLIVFLVGVVLEASSSPGRFGVARSFPFGRRSPSS